MVSLPNTGSDQIQGKPPGTNRISSVISLSDRDCPRYPSYNYIGILYYAWVSIVNSEDSNKSTKFSEQLYISTRTATTYHEVKHSILDYRLAKEKLTGIGGSFCGWVRSGMQWESFCPDMEANTRS